MPDFSPEPSDAIVADSGAAVSAPLPQPTPSFSPLYQQIKQAILHSLEAGEWMPLEAIPSEMELAKRYNVSKGTFVASHNERHVEYRFLRLHPDSGTVSTEGPAQRTILECKRARANAELARTLGLQSGDAVMQVRRLLTLGGTPTILEDIWLPAQLFKGLNADMLTTHQGPTYALFEKEFGVRTIRAEEQVRAVLPDAAQAELLEVTPHTPLLQVDRVSYTYNDAPVEVRKGLYRTDTHYYKNTLS